MTKPFLVCATVTAVNAFVSLGFAIASVPGANGQTRTLALYACARSIAFGIISVVPFATGWSLWLEAVAAGMIILQVLDAGIGVTIRDRMKTYGPAAIAVTNLAALLWLISR
jgi:phosphoglycerol transferase MdoB-like AlkP superfamily enzyme